MYDYNHLRPHKALGYRPPVPSHHPNSPEPPVITGPTLGEAYKTATC
ncbi:MAG: hypothetical protein IPP33_13880 [Flavobacteriales bacterium]|nr:hypothetical protein [Flavobacteriales bacterium]